jgi:hypothetical protein
MLMGGIHGALQIRPQQHQIAEHLINNPGAIAWVPGLITIVLHTVPSFYYHWSAVFASFHRNVWIWPISSGHAAPAGS